MITTGSKLLIGSAALAWIAAVVYGILQGGSLGSIGLISAAFALSVLAGLNAFLRDSNVSAMDHEGFDSAGAAQTVVRPSIWPLFVGLGVTAIGLGLVTYRAIFVVGVILFAAGGIEWMVQGWSERASADTRYNAGARNLMADPLEMPIAAAIVGAVVVFAFSRVMLGLPTKAATVIAFSIVAALVLAAGAFLWSKRSIKPATLAGGLSVVVLALVAAGAFAGLNGERETHAHATTADLAAADECGPDETDADRKASQSVASKSNPMVVLVYDGTRLWAEMPGFEGENDSVTVQRANPTSVLFRNRSNGAARLVAELRPALDENDAPVGPERVCTTLVDDGGTQYLLVFFNQPSFAAAEPPQFAVAGTDATVEVIVP